MTAGATGMTFLTGGARCGKSTLAVEMASGWAGPVAVVVTARAGDDEMAARIEQHRARRPREWTTVDAPEDLEGPLAEVPDDAFVIVDCLTLWVSNLLEIGASDEKVEGRARSAAAAASARSAPVVVVTNEVGSGIVPMNALARRFRDVQGRVNAIWAEAAEEAFLVVAGRVLRLETLDAR